MSNRGEVRMSLESSDPALNRVVNSMPEWATANNVEAEYISGGITNRNYCVRVDGQPFFVRLAGEETEALGIDRDNERSAVEAAAAAGGGREGRGLARRRARLKTGRAAGRERERV